MTTGKPTSWMKNELMCKPLDTYQELLIFLQNPPPWRTLCAELMPHSKYLIKNSDSNPNEILLESPQTFCHFDPDSEISGKRHEEKRLAKTLVCHDYANGYHDDCFIDGTSRYDTYTFYNWAGIDIFCYFSHHLITIPPVGWINVGHKHGVKVIGTVITEWTEGAAFWEDVLSSEEERRNFASALVATAKTLKFDGWLLNIENKIAKPEALLEFVSELHELLHQELSDAVLIWYDSVTIEGHLNWQNGLNDKNKAFFDACDGLFTNYSWSERDVASSAVAAGDRLSDLYIGVDVWGRNMFGGGHFNTQQAVKVARKYGCSLALFAPAWTHEALSEDPISMSEGLTTYEQFLLRDRALWGSLWPLLNTRLPCILPFQTSFCRGQGKKRRMYGEVLSPTPWYNIRHMQYQPNSSHGPHAYLLSSHEHIFKVCNHATYKDKKGIIRYRESFQASRLALHEVRRKEGDLQPTADSMVAIEDGGNEIDLRPTVSVDNGADRVEEEDASPFSNHENEGNDESPSKIQLREGSPIRKKMKNALRQLFRIKTSRLEERKEASSSSDGPSMVQMSVNLKLSEKSDKDKARLGLAYVPGELECLEVFYEDSFVGGSCLKINPSDEISCEHRTTRLLHCDFPCKDSLIFCVVTKSYPGYEEQYLNIELLIFDAEERDIKVALVGRSLPHHYGHHAASAVLTLYPLDMRDPEFKEVQKYILLNEPGFYVPTQNDFGWNVRYYEMEMKGSRVTSVACRARLGVGPVLLGHLGICPKDNQASNISVRNNEV